MLVSQDVIRREMLRVKDEASNPAIQLIYDLCMYGNKIGYTVILEGILSSKKYGSMLQKLLNDFDGESEMRKWWKDKDYFGTEGERIIDENMTQDQIVNLIKSP